MAGAFLRGAHRAVVLAACVASLLLNGQSAVAKVQLWLLMLRGDHELNEVKANKVPGLEGGFRFATLPEIFVQVLLQGFLEI